MSLDCLNNIVGLSRSDCKCFDDDRPTDYSTSASDLYISDLLPLKFTNSAKDCEDGGAWDILQVSRDRAIKAFIKDYSNKILKYKSYKFEPFSGSIGSVKFNTSLNYMSATNWTGLRIHPAYIKDGQMILTGFKLALDNLNLPSQSIDVFVYSSLDFTTPLAQKKIELTQNNKFFSASFDDPVILDLGNKEEDLEYYVVYQNTSGLRYVANKILEGCGCGDSKYRKNPFLNFVDLDGIEASTLENLENSPVRTDSNARGLILEGYTTCNIFNWLCRLSTNPQDLGSNLSSGNDLNLGMQMADAINHKAAFFAGERVLMSQNVNRITLMAPDALNQMLPKWEQTYMDYLNYFVYNVPDYVSDCFTCKVDKNISVNQILV